MMENTEEFWEASWMKHINTYLDVTPRAGIFIENYFKDASTILEISGGSCRDSRYLANRGFEATGSDFDEKTLTYLEKERFPNDKLRYAKEDTFNLSFSENSFDLVFHNGFFIYFDDNNSLKTMLLEQERVSKKYIVFFVHNNQNNNLIHLFKEKSQKDDLYKIRFFDKNEVLTVVKESGIKYKNIKLLKFGGFIDVFYKKRLKRIVPNMLYPFRSIFIPKLYQLQKWENTERICCVVELDK